MIRVDKNEWRRLLRYGIAGLSTSLLNIALFRLLFLILPEYRLANLISIVVTKIYAFFINKLYVFRSRSLSIKRQLREITSYVASRGFTGIVDYFGLIFMVSEVGFAPFPAKVIVQGIVIALNYVLGKFFVFRDPRSTAENTDTDRTQ